MEKGILRILQLQESDSGEDEGKCHMDFLWFVNLAFYRIFSLTLTSWLEEQEKKKKKKKTSQLYIYPQTTKFRHESILVYFNAHRKAIVEQNYSLVLLL